MTDTDTNREHALRLYEMREVPRHKAEPVIDAFLEKGFVLTDIGGGDIVWEAAFYTGVDTTGMADLILTVLSYGPRGLVEDLDTDDAGVNIQNGDAGGFFFKAPSPRLLLETYGNFNVRSRE